MTEGSAHSERGLQEDGDSQCHVLEVGRGNQVLRYQCHSNKPCRSERVHQQVQERLL